MSTDAAGNGPNAITIPTGNNGAQISLSRHIQDPLLLSGHPAPSIPTTTLTLAAASPAVSYVPPMNQISMPYIKRHAVKRVKTAKDACNMELQKTIHAITIYFEERLGEREREEAEEQYQKAQMQQRELQLRLKREHSIGSSIADPNENLGSNDVKPADLHAAIQQLHQFSRRELSDGGFSFDPIEDGGQPLSRNNSRRTQDGYSRSHSRKRE